MSAILKEVPVMGAQDFVARLRAIRKTHSAVNTPFIRAVAAGTASRRGVRSWSLEWYHLTLRTAPPQVRVPYSYRGKSPQILSSAFENAMGEVGYLADAPHPDLARAMCYGFDLSDEEIDAYVPTPLMLGYMAFAYLKTKGQAFDVTDPRVKTASNVVTEGDASATAKILVDGLRTHYGLDDRACIYWLVHAYADAGHAEEGEDMTVEMCDTHELQTLALRIAEQSMRLRNQLWSSWSALLEQARS